MVIHAASVIIHFV